MFRRIKSIRPRTFAFGVVALVLAMGGTATAAKMITGKNVKNNSLTGKDVKKLKSGDISNGTLKAVDLSQAARDELKGAAGAGGAAGAPGAKGDKGDTGATGERGPSNALADRTPGIQAVSGNNALTHELARTEFLPAGSYTIVGKLVGKAIDNGTVNCQVGDIIGPGDSDLFNELDQADLPWTANQEQVVTLVATVTIDSARPLVMQCAPEAGDTFEARDVTLIATQVGALG